jgi:ABC-type spermidine/putrescine transport system permease subunit I
LSDFWATVIIVLVVIIVVTPIWAYLLVRIGSWAWFMSKLNFINKRKEERNVKTK